MLFEISEPNQSANPHEKTYAIGIDLGTTHSLIACMRNSAVDVLVDETDNKLIPSCVYISANSQVLIGNDAINSSNDYFSSFKRFMGKNINDFSHEDINNIKHEINQYLSKNIITFKTADQQNINVIELSAHILSHLKNIAEQTMSGTLVGAVITVPAYFNDSQRKATKDAAKLAGLEVLRLINEPTAAALAYGLDNNSQGYYAVYDLGGGTFDVSILNIQEDIFEVVATAGHTTLGGDDFDEVIANYILDRLNISKNIKNNKEFISKAEFNNLKNIARSIKHELSIKDSITTNLNIQHKEYTIAISAKEFIEISKNLVNKTLDIFNQAIKDAKIKVQELKGIILVGGSTRMPCIQNELNKILPHKILTNLNPDEVVAIGAALQANSLIKGNDEWLLLDVVPLSLGIETMGGLVEKIIERNSTIPIAKAQEFTTYQNGQTAIKLHILQGEREKVEDCRSLATFILQGIPPMVAGMAKVRVTFSIDANGMLSVTATEQISGVNTHIEIETSYGLGEEQILNMLKQSIDNAKNDMAYRLFIEEEVNANQLIYACEQALINDKNILNNSEINYLNEQVIKLVKAIESTKNNCNSDELKKANEEFSNNTQFFADKRMNKAIMQAIGGKNIYSI